MINVSEIEKAIIKKMADHLKEARLARNESQEVFAHRLGLTRQSYSKMEKGSPAVPIGYWLMAGSILGLLDTWDGFFQKKQDLFALHEQRQAGRKKASGKRKSKS
jgi:DNA-binding XRE family transcriptional regulator